MNIFNYAIKRTRQEHYLTYFLARLFGNRKIIDYFFLFYIYMRIVDDKIDDEIESNNLKLEYLRNQVELLNLPESELDPETGSSEEKIIKVVKQFDRDYGNFVVKRIKRMMDVFKFDIERLGRRVPRSRLFKFFYIEARVSLEIILFFIIADPNPDIKQTIELGFTSKLSHVIRDLEEDLEEGIINIPAEYEGDRGKWLKEAVELIQEKNKIGYRGIFSVRNFRYGLVCLINTIRYKWELKSFFYPGWRYFNKVMFILESLSRMTGYSLKYLFLSRRQT